MSELFNAINDELKLVNTKINEELNIKKAGHAGKYAHLDFSRVDSTMRPAIVILTAKLFDYKRDQIIVLASIMQFIYMASRVHANITEIDPPVNQNVDPRDGIQFPVLVGDYLYGKFFTLLSDAKLIKYLDTLAETICSINEGEILKNQNPKATMSAAPDLVFTIVRKETAELFANCSYLAARVSGANDEERKNMYNFGLNFGLGYGLLEQGASHKFAAEYFQKAVKCLDSLDNGPVRDQLIELINMVKENEELLMHRMVG
ncbi:MAG: polyprenyl synthetase family protein [Desulfotomaculum sp.]|nr:polyprenyl synthetase family protein [Desulfotomaculum sp.]